MGSGRSTVSYSVLVIVYFLSWMIDLHIYSFVHIIKHFKELICFCYAPLSSISLS